MTAREGTIADLIARLEKATGNEWELDRLIFEAVHFPAEYGGSKVESWSRGGAGHGYTINTVDGWRHLDACNAPNYTASIDDALTLVTERWRKDIWLKRHNGHHWSCELHIPSSEVDGRHVHAPIAICIAALRLQGREDL